MSLERQPGSTKVPGWRPYSRAISFVSGFVLWKIHLLDKFEVSHTHQKLNLLKMAMKVGFDSFAWCFFFSTLYCLTIHFTPLILIWAFFVWFHKFSVGCGYWTRGQRHRIHRSVDLGEWGVFDAYICTVTGISLDQYDFPKKNGQDLVTVYSTMVKLF